MLGPPLLPLLMTFCWGALQGAPIDGTWELARIFRSGPTAASHPVPIDSTVYLCLTPKDDARRMDRGAAVSPLLRQGRAVENRGGPARSHGALHHRRRPGLPRIPEGAHRRVARG